MSHRRVLVTGAGGLIGHRLVAQLADACGWEKRPTSRRCMHDIRDCGMESAAASLGKKEPEYAVD